MPIDGLSPGVRWHTSRMSPEQAATAAPSSVVPTGLIEALRTAGARFAILHGSRAVGDARPDADYDVAAWWDENPPQAFDVLVPPGVDLLVLNTAPLELAGRIALHGVVIHEDDAAERVRWQATTRKIYADELPRIRRSHAEFARSLRESPSGSSATERT